MKTLVENKSSFSFKSNLTFDSFCKILVKLIELFSSSFSLSSLAFLEFKISSEFGISSIYVY